MATYQPIAADATDLPINEIVLNVEWAGLVIEHLTALQSSSSWSGTDAEIEHCISQIETVKDLLMGYDLIPPNIAFQASKASSQALNDNNTVLCPMTTLENNAGGYYNTGNSRFTPLKAGRYGVWVNLNFTGAALRGWEVRRNGSMVLTSSGNTPNGTTPLTYSLSGYGEVYLDGVDDYLELFVWRFANNVTVNSGLISTWGARLVAW